MMTAPQVLDSAEAIRDHLVLAVPPWDRQATTVRFVLCDSDLRVLAHCPVRLRDSGHEPADAANIADVFATALARAAGPDRSPGMLVVLTRPGEAQVTAADRLWFQAAHRVCGRRGVRLLGVYLLSGRQHRELTVDDAG
jgi:hypothetical protein